MGALYSVMALLMFNILLSIMIDAYANVRGAHDARAPSLNESFFICFERGMMRIWRKIKKLLCARRAPKVAPSKRAQKAGTKGRHRGSVLMAPPPHLKRIRRMKVHEATNILRQALVPESAIPGIINRISRFSKRDLLTGLVASVAEVKLPPGHASSPVLRMN